MTNSPKQNVFNPACVLTIGLGLVFFAVVCLLISQGAVAETVTVTGMNNATNYDNVDIVDNLETANAYEHTGMITGNSSLTINATIASDKSRFDYRQWLKGSNGSYTFTGPININGGQLLIDTGKLSTETINLNGGDMYVMYTDCLPHDAVVNVGEGSFLDVEVAANAIKGATINVASGGTFRMCTNTNDADNPITLNIAGTGTSTYTGAIHVHTANTANDIFLTANINVSGDAKIFSDNVATNRQFLIYGALTGSSTLTLTSNNSGRYIRLDEKLNMSGFSGNFIADNAIVRFYSSSLGTGSNITVQNSATACFKYTNALNNYNGSFTVNNATISLEADGKLNNLSGDANGKVSFGSKTLTLNNTSNTTFNGTLTGTGAITKNGSGELTLTHNISGVNLTSKAGALVLGTANNNISIGSSSIIKADGGAVRVDGNVVVDSEYLSVSGNWTGNGNVTVNSGGMLRINGTFGFTNGITLNGGLLFNDGEHNGETATVSSPITVASNSNVQCGWSGTLTLSGGLNGSGGLTINNDSGWTIVTGKGNYSGPLTIIGNFRPGASGIGTEAAPAKASDYIGSGEITFKSNSSTQGIFQNNNNHLTFSNDLNFAKNSYLKSGWSKSMTFTGNLKGSGQLEVLSDSGWVIMATKCTDDAFTGNVQLNWDKSDSMGKMRLGSDQPFGAKAGQGNIYGTLDMNGYSQRFNGLYNNGNKGPIYNNNNSKQSTLTIDTTTKNLTYQSPINGNIALEITGTGTQTFSNNGSNFTGNIVIDGGTLKATAGHSSYTTTAFGAFSTSGGRTITVNSGAELVLGTNDVLGGCAISNFNENSMRLILNGGKVTGTNNNPLYNATFQNGAEVYGSNNRDIYRSFWLLGTNTVSFAGDGSTPESPVKFNGASGVIFVLDGTVLNVEDITLSDESDLVVNVSFGNKSESPITTNSLTKTGAGTVELTAANEYTAGTTISEGVLKFTDNAVVANGPITVGTDGTLEYNLSSGQTKKLTITNASKIFSTGKVVKTGDGTLQIYTAAAGQVDASSFIVSSGRLDMKEYFKGSLDVEANATMSPGNSVGKLTVDGTYNLDSGAALLLEVGKDDLGNIVIDQLFVNGNATFEPGSIIDIVLDPSSSLVGGDEFSSVIITANNAESIFNDVKAAIRSYYFTDLTVTRSGNEISLSGRLDPNAVPEPSTWALLILGVVALFLRKRFRS